MKYSFALAAIVAIASAQEAAEDWTSETVVEPVPEPSAVEKLFELNEAGQFQLVHPKSPAISFTDADDAAIQAYFEGKMADATALDMEFLDAWKNYESVVSQPWNDFLTQVEDLTVRGIDMDAKTDQEVVTWMAQNTFVDGESLYDKYPQVQDVLTGIQAQADQMKEHFSLDGLRATPNALYYKHHSLQSEMNYDSPDYYYEEGEWEEPSHPVRDHFEEEMQQKADNLMSYGFDPEVVNRWFEDQSRSFEELQQQQDMESAKEAQTAVREAADYMKGIADAWIADMPRQHDEWMAEHGAKLEEAVGNMKTKLDEQAAHDIAAIDSWVNDTYSQIVDMTEEQVDVNPWDETVMLAKKSTTNKSEKYAYGFAAASVGFAAMGAYIYLSKKQQKVVSTEGKDQLLDAGFQQV